jgi:hypothetical protein
MRSGWKGYAELHETSPMNIRSSCATSLRPCHSHRSLSVHRTQSLTVARGLKVLFNVDVEGARNMGYPTSISASASWRPLPFPFSTRSNPPPRTTSPTLFGALRQTNSIEQVMCWTHTGEFYQQECEHALHGQGRHLLVVLTKMSSTWLLL